MSTLDNDENDNNIEFGELLIQFMYVFIFIYIWFVASYGGDDESLLAVCNRFLFSIFLFLYNNNNE